MMTGQHPKNSEQDSLEPHTFNALENSTKISQSKMTKRRTSEINDDLIPERVVLPPSPVFCIPYGAEHVTSKN
jgi:hypothetical protein